MINAGDTYLESLGRILQLDVTVKNVCPYKRVALAVILTEIDSSGAEYQRGMPEDLDVSGGTPNAMCNTRNFKVRFIAHNIDTDYQCCDSAMTVV